MFSSFISFFSSFLALQFRINEGLLSDDIRKAYRDELVRRKAEGGHEDESEMRMIHGLETYKMEANPKYTKLFAEDAVYVTNMRKSRGTLPIFVTNRCITSAAERKRTTKTATPPLSTKVCPLKVWR